MTATVKWKTVLENKNAKPKVVGSLQLSANDYFGGKKYESNEEFRVVFEWAHGSMLTGNTKRDGVIGMYSAFKAGFSGALDKGNMVVLHAADEFMRPHKEANAHLYYAAKTKVWVGWGLGSRGWSIDKSKTTVDTKAGLFFTSFEIDLEKCPGLKQGDSDVNLGVAWAIDWEGGSRPEAVKASDGGGKIAEQKWPILWVPSLNPDKKKTKEGGGGDGMSTVIIIVVSGVLAMVVLLTVVCCCFLNDDNKVEVVEDPSLTAREVPEQGDSIDVEMVQPKADMKVEE